MLPSSHPSTHLPGLLLNVRRTKATTTVKCRYSDILTYIHTYTLLGANVPMCPNIHTPIPPISIYTYVDRYIHTYIHPYIVDISII